MNILNELGKERKFYYFEDNNLESANLNLIIEEKQRILSYFENFVGSINCYDEYINFLFLDSVVELTSNLEIILPKYIDDGKNIKNFCELQIKKVSNKNLAIYLKNNYKEVFECIENESCNRVSIFNKTLNYITSLLLAETDIVLYSIHLDPLIILQYINQHISIFKSKNSTIFFDAFLNEEVFNIPGFITNHNLVNLLELLKQNNNLFRDKIYIYCEQVKCKYFNTCEENVMNTLFIIKDVFSILKKLKVPEAFDFEIELEQQNKIMDQYLVNRGKKSSYTYSFEEIIKLFDDESVMWELRILSLTHFTDKKSKKIISLFENIFINMPESIISIIARTNLETDTIFTASRIQQLTLVLEMNINIFYAIVSDEKRAASMFNMLYSELESCFDDFQIIYDKDEYFFYMDILFKKIWYLINLNNNKKTIDNDILGDYYGAIMLLFALFEKIIKDLYLGKVKNEKYVSEDGLSLGYLLSAKEVIELLGVHNCNVFSYIFLYRSGVGLNYRNNFAHLNSIVKSKLNITTLMTGIYCLTMLINCLACNYKLNTNENS